VVIRSTREHLLLIAQTDHAALAERIMRAWRRDGLPDAPRRDVILYATRRHDDGWIEHDRAPLVDAASGQLLDYVHAPDDIRRGIWPDGVERLAANPYAAALVAQHAAHLFDKYRNEPGWDLFIAGMERSRDRLIAAAPLAAGDLQADYFFVRMGDLLSLQFCDDWREPQEYGGYRSSWDGARLTVSPDPFAGAEVTLCVTARRLANRRYQTSADAAAAFAAAPAVTLTGIAAGSR
jgi:hypothetical protein